MGGERLTDRQLAGFARDVLAELWEGGTQLDGEVIELAALKHGLITCVAFNPKKHNDHLGIGMQAGDDWFEEHPSLKRLAGRAALAKSEEGGR